jgi:D-alanyl-D-alanine carboxypeptidase/D-alanyl-D-alanine-endopeptidase (penicillin-binding protein 4)
MTLTKKTSHLDVSRKKTLRSRMPRLAGKVKIARADQFVCVLLSVAILLMASGACSVMPSAAESSNMAAAPPQTLPPAAPSLDSNPELNLAPWYAGRVEDSSAHAALIATLTPGKLIAAHNADTPFNPASLIKLATSLVALHRLGPDFRFAVHAYAAGEIDKAGVLHGDLYFTGSHPTFNDFAGLLIAGELKARGVRRITGSVFVSPDFCFNFSDSPEKSAELLARLLPLDRKTQTGVAALPNGTELFTIYSHKLAELLLYMNTHSSNFVAHRIGDFIGGANGVRQFLLDELHLPPDQVLLTTVSGLEHNQMNARGLLVVLRALVAETRSHGLEPAAILPIANEQRSTLRRRFPSSPLKDAILAKTGTLRDIDGGVANLAGLIYTQSAGEIAFVLLDQGTQLAENRELQDALLQDAVGNRFTVRPVVTPAEREPLAATNLQIEQRAEIRKSEAKGKNEEAKAGIAEKKENADVAEQRLRIEKSRTETHRR